MGNDDMTTLYDSWMAGANVPQLLPKRHSTVTTGCTMKRRHSR